MCNKHNPAKFYVSRQHYYYSGELCVEIAQGGLDYAGSDMLVEKYKGEGEEYIGMVAAVEAAIAIAEAWQNDVKNEEIFLSCGCTHGIFTEMEGKKINDEFLKELRDGANRFDEQLPKCDQCGEIIEEEYKLWDYEDWQFCREYCAEEWYANEQRELALLDEDNNNE